jgi:hypothetical protein
MAKKDKNVRTWRFFALSKCPRRLLVNADSGRLFTYESKESARNAMQEGEFVVPVNFTANFNKIVYE